MSETYADKVRAEYAHLEARAAMEDVVDVAERVDKMGKVGWLIDGLWPSDAYGVLGAEDKAGKTWVVTDLAVSVATGTPWLGKYPVEQGIVILYAGEGGARNIIRRVRAIAEFKGRPFGTLRGTLYVSEVAPHFKESKALDLLDTEVKFHGPKLVIVDPLYLAARGGKGSDLYAMGEVLEGPQLICQEHNAALLVTHHWNKTGSGTGAQRFTGVGPGAWGRVLGSGSVEKREMFDGGKTVVTVEWDFIGSEIPGGEFTMVRTVWADDEHDLSSPLHYEVTTTDGTGNQFRHFQKNEEVHDFLLKHPDRVSQNAVEKVFGRTGRERLKELEAAGRADWVLGLRGAKMWAAKD